MAFERVNQFKDAWLDYDAPSGLTLKLYTDMGAGSPQRTLSFPATSGRAKHTRTCESGGSWLEGTLIRPRVESAGIVRLYGGGLHVRPVGVYFDGSNSEVWDPGELSLG